MNEIKQLVDELNHAFKEHKVKNDERLANLEKNGLEHVVSKNQDPAIEHRHHQTDTFRIE